MDGAGGGASPVVSPHARQHGVKLLGPSAWSRQNASGFSDNDPIIPLTQDREVESVRAVCRTLHTAEQVTHNGQATLRAWTVQLAVNAAGLVMGWADPNLGHSERAEAASYSVLEELRR